MNEAKMKELYDQFCKEYSFLYDHQDKVAGYREAVSFFDNELPKNEYLIKVLHDFAEYRQDLIVSDREAGAFCFALETLDYL